MRMRWRGSMDYLHRALGQRMRGIARNALHRKHQAERRLYHRGRSGLWGPGCVQSGDHPDAPSIRMRYLVVLLLVLWGMGGGCAPEANEPDPSVTHRAFEQAAQRGVQANQALQQSHRFVEGWLAHADEETGLIPRNLEESRHFWNGKDAAADNWPFMVLTTALTDRELYQGRMHDMLGTETQRTSRLDALVDPYSFRTNNFLYEEPDLDRMIFESAEYVKDGLMPITEWLGSTPFSDRMIDMVDAILKHGSHETSFGRLPADDVEVNGEMMQVLSRLRFMTGEERYLDRAIQIADYYLLGDHHPTRDLDTLRLRDHGNELISGLTEVYAASHFVREQKVEPYREPLHAMLDRILDVGVNRHGMMYDEINPKTGEVHVERLADTWGYNYNGYYTVYLLDGVDRYRHAVRRALASLHEHYREHDWEDGSADGIADAVESALNLYAREGDVEGVAPWIDENMQRLLAKQKPSGVVEGWHGDGNFARTAIMWALWKQQGITVRPWREDVELGAVRRGDTLYVSLSAESDWSGTLRFDAPRHETVMNLSLDYPRINQFPAWFTVGPDVRYRVATATEEGATYPGEALIDGASMDVAAGEEVRLIVTPIPDESF